MSVTFISENNIGRSVSRNIQSPSAHLSLNFRMRTSWFHLHKSPLSGWNVDREKLYISATVWKLHPADSRAVHGVPNSVSCKYVFNSRSYSYKNPFPCLLLDLSWPDENFKFTIILFVVEVEEDLLLGRVCKKYLNYLKVLQNQTKIKTLLQ